MKYSVKYEKEALKFLKLHHELREKLLTAFQEIALDYPTSAKKYDIRKLSGYNDLFRLRIGKYRAIYTIINNELVILVLNIDSRGDIYKNI